MDGTRKAQGLSLQARAAMIRRAQSRKRTVKVNRTPNAPLAPSMDVARDALEIAWESTQELRAEHEAKPMRQMTHKTRPPKTQGQDAFGPVYVQGTFVRYGVQYRTRLVGAERKTYVRNDDWARARSQAVGEARLQHVIDSRTIAGMREHIVARTSVAGNGGYARIWTAPGERLRFRDYATVSLHRDAEAVGDSTLWAERWGVLDGQAYRFEFNRETGEMRKPRA